MVKIRPSSDDDINRITEIYAYYVLNTTSTFELTPPTTDEMVQRRLGILSRNMPYLIAEDNNGIIGYAYCDWFKPRPAYRFTAEVSIYLDKDSCGQGYGRQLLSSLIEEAKGRGVRKLMAVISDVENGKSLGLHRSLGFIDACTLKSAGWKMNRWLDVTFMERSLGLGDTVPPQDVI